MMALADHIIVPTTEMKRRVFDATHREAFVIGDPYEQEECPPHTQGDNLLWFGHNLNLKDLLPYLNLVDKFDFTICTGPHLPESDEDCRYVKWSPEALKEEFKRANLVLLPTRKGVEHKTSNRLVNAIRAGCFPICGNHPGYYEFRQMAWVGDIHTGLRWAKAFPHLLDELVLEAQEYVRERYSPLTIGKQWCKVMEAL
jgi:hypothetical protein